ncbi:hypothetical protein COMNV_01089 [Commensalibacter sp. Nvir]|uniref:ClpXP protease specificity-enhancing factor SspB n=1 Tax=Commensalibacter sp. Nvir TaxID=3069817 RepID=UPI002D5B526D|nr:hypothetical protein COMNV_01089 [Commensalibacter sp. Nvir]
MSDANDSNNDDFDGNPPSALIPYQEWIESAHRQVMLKALHYILEKGLPGKHSFYITFDTTYPGVIMPDRLKTQYPSTMTIVLQHQFWDLAIDEPQQILTLGLSFGGIPSKLSIPLGSITTFIDPEAKLSLVFQVLPTPTLPISTAEVKENTREELKSKKIEENEPQIIRLDQFRKK